MLLFHIILKNIILENVQTSEMQNLKDPAVLLVPAASGVFMQ